MVLGDNWEPCQRDDICMDQSPWAMKRWSLVVTLPALVVTLPAGKLTFIIVSDDYNFLAILKLKSGTSPTKVTRLSIQPCQTMIIGLELLSTLFPSISAPLETCVLKF